MRGREREAGQSPQRTARGYRGRAAREEPAGPRRSSTLAATVGQWSSPFNAGVGRRQLQRQRLDGSA
eukprot:7339384-Alexandrium_andersonii.AAC.1